MQGWGWTHTIQVDAPAEGVWPWVAQIGADRGGFYSYQWLENLIGCQVRNAGTIHPEWAAREGAELSLHPKAPALRIVSVEPGRALVAYMAPVRGMSADGRPGEPPHPHACAVAPQVMCQRRRKPKYATATPASIASTAPAALPVMISSPPAQVAGIHLAVHAVRGPRHRRPRPPHGGGWSGLARHPAEHAGRADHVVAIGHKRLEEGAEPVDAYQPAGGNRGRGSHDP